MKNLKAHLSELRGIGRSAIVPVLAIASGTALAVWSDGFFRYAGIGLLAGMALVSWLLMESWKKLAANSIELLKKATMISEITTLYGTETSRMLADVIAATEEDLPELAKAIESDLRDAYAVYTEKHPS